jgi:hypothetical protein
MSINQKEILHELDKEYFFRHSHNILPPQFIPHISSRSSAILKTSKTIKPIKSFASSYFSSAESTRSNYSGIRKEKGRLDAGTSKKDRQTNFQKYR